MKHPLSELTGEAGEVGALQPPYPLLLRSWLLPDGALAIDLNDGNLLLPAHTLRTLQDVADNRKEVLVEVKTAISAAVLSLLAGNGIGVFEESSSGKQLVCRPPRAPEEIPTVNAFQVLLQVLRKNGPSQAEVSLSKAIENTTPQYCKQFGFTVLVCCNGFGIGARTIPPPKQSRLWQVQG